VQGALNRTLYDSFTSACDHSRSATCLCWKQQGRDVSSPHIQKAIVGGFAAWGRGWGGQANGVQLQQRRLTSVSCLHARAIFHSRVTGELGRLVAKHGMQPCVQLVWQVFGCIMLRVVGENVALHAQSVLALYNSSATALVAPESSVPTSHRQHGIHVEGCRVGFSVGSGSNSSGRHWVRCLTNTER
jgi:hypothetical protein